MLKLTKILIIFLLTLLFFNKSFSNDVPVIVISPGKTPQSKGTVGQYCYCY